MNGTQNINSLLVKPASADCNIACEYCFYCPKAALYPDTKIHRMDEHVLSKFIKDYMELSGEHASFGWQGGEPLLMGLDFYKKAIEYQKLHGKPGQIVGNGFQTNATLIDEDWARFFYRYNFLLGVSLDGPAEFHNFYRKDKAGKPTFDRVMNSINILKRFRVDFNILCLLNSRNVKHPVKIYEFFIENGFDFMQFIPCVEINPNTGEIADFSIKPDEYGDFLCDVFDVWYNNGKPTKSIRFFDDVLATYMGMPAPSCHLQEKCGSYVVIEHNGDVYACDFFVEPEWFLGNVMETPLKEIVSSDKFLAFSKRKANLSDVCNSCKWQPICHGGCPKYRIIKHNSAEMPTYFCNSYKKFFEYTEERFRKLARRLRRQQRW